MNCHQCQQEVPTDARFCIHCGSSQEPAAIAAGTTLPTTQAANVNIATPAIAPMQPNLQPGTAEYNQMMAMQKIAACPTCKGGTHYEPGKDVCPNCRSLRPLEPGYTVDPSMFQWAQDGKAMATLRSIGPLNALAKKLSDRVGRKWIEASFNGVRLSEKQMPKVYFAALRAARILGLKQMPDVYVSGERPWDSHTFGSNESAFVVMGSALVSSFRGADLMFLFAREMGHILAGHALWKTVIRFLVGEHNPKSGLMRNGIAGLMDPGKWLEGAIEIPLLSWARQAEITADRAGMLAVGRMETVRRTLLSWTLKSPFLYQQINVNEWLRQQEDDSQDEHIRLSELVTSSTPYVTRRLKLIADFESDPLVGQFKQFIAPILKKDIEASKLSRTIESKAKAASESSDQDEKKEETLSQDQASAVSNVKLACPSCKKQIELPANILRSEKPVPIRCSHADCREVNVLQPKADDSKVNRARKKKKQLEQQNLQAAD